MLAAQAYGLGPLFVFCGEFHKAEKIILDMVFFFAKFYMLVKNFKTGEKL